MFLDNIKAEQKNLKRFLNKLTKLKIHKQLLKRKNGNAHPVSLDNGYFESSEYFRNRFLIEKRRAERKDYEFSLIIIDLLEEVAKVQPGSDHNSLDSTENVLLTTLQMILRATDVIVKYCPSKLAILLPDTGKKGAELVIERINKAVKEIVTQFLLDIFSKTKIYSYCYPVQADEIDKLVDNKLVTEKNSTIALEKTIRGVKSNYFQMRNSTDISKRSAIKVSSKNTIALENPLCLLNEVFFDFTGNWQNIFKRYFDISISLFAIILLSPIFLFISIFIKITSPGPVFFKQGRVGYMGKIFTIYKFRTMYQVEDEQIHKQYVKNFINNSNLKIEDSGQDNQVYKIINDPRVTPIGRFLRRTSLDEIGQFINVLKGEMSLVGPRPPIPYEVEMYDLWHKRRFLTTKPGITGLWQIYGRNTIEFNDMVRLDLAYVKNWSLSLDFKIILKTIKAVLSMKGAY